MSQTTYAEQSAYLPGMKGDARDDLVISAIGEGAVPFGKYVCRGTDAESQCKLPAAAIDVTTVTNRLGVALKTHAIESSDSGIPTYKDKDMVSIARRAVIAVVVEEAVTTASDVYVRYATGTGSLGLGSFRASDPGSEAAQLANARYVKGASGSGEIALVEIDFA